MGTLVVCSLLTAGVGQTPAIQEQVEAQLAALRANRDDLQTALANHPDVQIAEARLRVAQAELAKVKMMIAQQVTATRAKVDQARAVLAAVEPRAKQAAERVKGGVAGREHLTQANQELAVAKSAVAAAESELRTLTGSALPAVGPKPVPLDDKATDVHRFPFRGYDIITPAAPAADKLRETLEASHVLDLPSGATLRAACDQLADVFKPRGLVVRDPGEFSNVGVQFWKDPPAVGPLKGERPVGQWLQLVADAFTASVGLLPNPGSRPVGGRWDFYVRDYGLLFARADDAPAGAETVGQFMGRTAAAAPPLSPELRRKVRELLGKTVKLPARKWHPRSTLKELGQLAGTDLVLETTAFTGEEADDEPAGELTVAGWLDLLRDRWAAGVKQPGQYQFFVREYGLVLCYAPDAPPGAVPLAAVK